MNSNENTDLKIFLPRKGSFEYKFLLAPEKKRKKFLKRFRIINKYVVVPLYKAGIIPLFGLGRLIILIYTKGRKTGLERVTPIEHQIINGDFYIFVGRGEKAHWLRNMLANPEDVKIKKGFKKYPVKFELIKDMNTVIEVYKWFVSNVPILPRFVFGWRKRKDKLNNTDFSYIAENLSLVKIWKK